MTAKQTPPGAGGVPASGPRREHQDGRIVTVPGPPPPVAHPRPKEATMPSRPTNAPSPTREQVDAAKVGEPLLATLESTGPLPKFAPGETTTEFWLTVVGIVAAVVLACFGKITGAEALAASTVAGTGYSVSRGLAKR